MPAASRSRCLRDLPESTLIRQIVPHLLILDISAPDIDPCGRDRILYDGVEQSIGQVHPIFIHKIMKSCHKTKRLCISFKVKKILPHLFVQHPAHRFSEKRKPGQIFLKPLSDRILSEMSERRISDIMDQARTLQYVRDIFSHFRCEARIFTVFQDILPDVLPQRLSQRRHLQGMGQSGPYKITFIQREHLSLILKAPKRCAPDDPVIVFFKFAPQIRRSSAAPALPLPFFTQQPAPLHSLHILHILFPIRPGMNMRPPSGLTA